MAPSASDTILASLHQIKKNSQLPNEILEHFKSLKSHYDIACFSTSVANQVFKDITTATPDTALLLLKCAEVAITQLELVPDSYITKSLQPLSLEKLWQRLISKLLEKAQYPEAKRFLAHLLDRLQRYQGKSSKEPQKKDKTTDFSARPAESDTVEFRKCVVSALFLEIQLAFSAGEPMEQVLSLVPRWDTWVNHLGLKEKTQTDQQNDILLRLLVNCVSKKPEDPRLLDCMECALEHTLPRRDVFFDVAGRFSSMVADPKQSETRKSIDFQSMASKKVEQLPKASILDIGYIIWGVSCVSASIGSKALDLASSVMGDLSSHIKKYSGDNDEVVIALISVWSGLLDLHKGSFSSAATHFAKTSHFMSTDLEEITMSSTSVGPPASVLSSKSSPPHIYTLLLRLARAVEEVRSFYSVQMRRRTSSNNPKETEEPATSIPTKLLEALAGLMGGQVQIVDKGVEFDTTLSKMQGQPVETFSAYRSLQVEALHAGAQLHYEATVENSDKLASITTYYERSINIVAMLKDKQKAPSISNLLLRTYQLGSQISQKGHWDVAVSLLEIAVRASAQMEGTLPVSISSIYSLMAHCHSKSGDIAGAMACAEKGLKHEYSSSNSKAKKDSSNPTPTPTSTQLIEQFVVSASKLETAFVSKSLSGWAKGNLSLIEEIMKAYQRLAPGATQQQMMVVEHLLSLCVRGTHPVRHARALVEKAKLVRIIPSSNSSHTPDVLLREAINLLKADQLSEDEDENKYIMDELAKAHMWLAIYYAESHDSNVKEPNLYNNIALAIKHAQRGLSFWSKLSDSLHVQETKLQQNKSYFVEPVASIRIMKIVAEFLATVDDIASQIQILELAGKFAQCLDLPLYEFASVQLSLAEVYIGGGYPQQTEFHLQKAEAVLSQKQQATQKQQAQYAAHYDRVSKQASIVRLQLDMENGHVHAAEKLDHLVDELDTSKKSREDILLLAWVKRLRASCTQLPYLAFQDAKDSFSLIVSILPEYKQTSTSASGNPATTSSSTKAESSMSRWLILRHFLASVECVVHNNELAGKPREAYVVYCRALSVALLTGAILHVGSVSLGIGELEYYRNNWSMSKQYLRQARAAFMQCTSLLSQGAKISSAPQSSFLGHKHMNALVDMRLGDVYRREGKLTKALKCYSASRATISELQQFAPIANGTLPVSLQRCADASPRESKILGILERSNKQVKLQARAPAKKEKIESSSSSSAESSNSVSESSSDDTTTRRRTVKSKQVKLKPRTTKTSKKPVPVDSDEEPVPAKPAPKKATKAAAKKKQTKNDSDSDGESAKKPVRSTKSTSSKNQDIPFYVASLLARLDGKLARIDILRGRYDEAIEILTDASKRDTTPITSAVLQLHLATAYILSNSTTSSSRVDVTALVDSLAHTSNCLIPSLRSRICHTIADLDRAQAPYSIDIPRQQMCQLLSDSSLVGDDDNLHEKMSKLSVEEDSEKPIPKAVRGTSRSSTKTTTTRSKKAAASTEDGDAVPISQPLSAQQLVAQSSKYSITAFKSLHQSLPSDWVVCSVCVPRGQRVLWISRVQAGKSPLVFKISLKALPPSADFLSLNSVQLDGKDATSESSDSSDNDTKSTKTTPDWADNDENVDAHLVNSGYNSEDGDDEQISPHNEDGLLETELGGLVAATQRIIDLSNTTSKHKATTNKQKQQWWDNRKLLDNKMKEVVDRIEEDVLGWRKAIFVAPPADKTIRGTLAEAASSLASDLSQDDPAPEDDDMDVEEEPKPRATRSKAKTTTKTTTKAAPSKLKKAVPAAQTSTPIDHHLLEVCLGAAPFLTDSQIEDALAAISGKAVNSKWVQTFRSAYDKCIGESEKSRTSKEKSEPVLRQTLMLALDGKLQRLPWESLPVIEAQSVTRVPSLLFAGILHSASHARLKNGIDPKKAFYLLNAEGDLVKTQECFETPFKRRPGWQGIVGSRPSVDDYKKALMEHDLFVYCGHGSSEQYLKRDVVARLPRCSTALLMGCSSGHLRYEGDFEPNGMATSFLLALSPAVVGNLWDVTDGDLDRLTKALLDNWLDRGLSLPRALSIARGSCQFKYLVAAAAVCYGIPVRVTTSR